MSDCDKRFLEYSKYNYTTSFEISELLIYKKNEGKGPKGEIRDYLSPKLLLNKKGVRFMRKKR